MDMTITTNEQLALYLAYHSWTTDKTIDYLELAKIHLSFLNSQAATLQTKEESKAIPELSDEEIDDIAHSNMDLMKDEIYAFIEGMKAYRELIKSKQ